MSHFTIKDKSVMRGMPIHAALHGFGEIFGEAAGSSETYALSEPVEELEVFLSHNWSTTRVAKFRALVLHYNAGRAIRATLLASAAGAWLTAVGAVPYFQMESMPNHPRGFASFCLGSFSFWATLLCGHELDHYFPRLRSKQAQSGMFLDKACINQTDDELKKQGIKSLGGFLAKSRKIIMLYSHSYFRRIWTVYELACFLCVKSPEDCVFLSVYLPPCVFCGWVCVALYFITSTVVAVTGNNALPVTIVIALTTCSCGMVMARRAWKEIDRLKRQLLRFSIGECGCLRQEDRSVICRGIVSFVKYKGLVGRSSSDEFALGFFERQLRKEMGGVLQAVVGRTMISYSQALVISLPQLMVAFDTLGAKLAHGDPFYKAFAASLYYAAEACLSFPMALALAMMLAGQWTHLKGLADALYTLVALALSIAVYTASDIFDFVLSPAADEVDVDARRVILYCVFSALEGLLAWLIYSRRPCCCWHRDRLSTNNLMMTSPEEIEQVLSMNSAELASNGEASRQKTEVPEQPVASKPTSFGVTNIVSL